MGSHSVAQLRADKRLQLEERLLYRRRWKSDSGLIFTNTKGKPIDPTNLLRVFHGIMAQTDLPKIRFHDLRHTAASLMLARGVHPKIVVIFRAIMVHVFSPKLGHAFSPKLVHRFSPKVVHRFSPKVVHSFSPKVVQGDNGETSSSKAYFPFWDEQDREGVCQARGRRPWIFERC